MSRQVFPKVLTRPFIQRVFPGTYSKRSRRRTLLAVFSPTTAAALQAISRRPTPTVPPVTRLIWPAANYLLTDGDLLIDNTGVTADAHDRGGERESHDHRTRPLASWTNRIVQR